MQKIMIGFLLGLSVNMLMGAVATSDTDRELERMRSEIAESNGYLQNISRSLDRIDDAFGSSRLTVRVDD